MNIRFFVIISQVPDPLFIENFFPILFSLCCSHWVNFSHSVFQFTDSFFYPLHSSAQHIHWDFYFGFCIFSSKCLLGCTLYFTFPCWGFLFLCWSFLVFSFISTVFVVAYWSAFIMNALKSLLDNSDCHLDVGINRLPFFILPEIFPVLGVKTDFQLKPEHICITLWDTGSYLNLLF